MAILTHNDTNCGHVSCRPPSVTTKGIGDTTYPLVGKLETFLSRYGQTIHPSFESDGGTADHLTGSLVTN